jgi:Tol biopolymer transport system component
MRKRRRLIGHSLAFSGLILLAGCGGSGEKHDEVAYSTVRDEVPTRIIVVEDDGKNARRVSGAKRGANPVLPAWSPDAEKIAFVRYRPQGGPRSLRTSVVNEDGSGERELAEGTLPGWANGGSSLVVERPRAAPNQSTIYVLSVDGKTAPRKLVVGSSPAVSHDGKRVAFVRYTYKRKSGGECCVTTKTELFTIGVDGSGLRRISQTGREGQYTQPSWLPDDSEIAVLERRGGLGGPLWTVSLAGKKRRIVSNVGETYDWSPKGDLIAYTRGGLMYIVRPDGTEVENYGQSNAIDIEWSPDGKKVAFSMQESLENMQFVGLYLIDTEKHERRRFVIADGYAAYLDWRPDVSD